MIDMTRVDSEYGILSENGVASAKAVAPDSPQLGKGVVGSGVFIIVDELGVLWRIDANVGSYRRVVSGDAPAD